MIMGIILVIIFNMAILPSISVSSNQVWNEAATVGNLQATNHYIMYTDLMCPYCDVFSREVMNHWDEFQQYLAENDVLFEIRLTDYLYEASGSEYSRGAAEGAYCAMREDKFWDYYHQALANLWKDYHSKGIGSNKSAPMIKDLPEDYWLKAGRGAGLGDDFADCLNAHATVGEIEHNTRRALQIAQGMPYFKFNKFTTAGFDDSWGYEYVKRYLDAGLEAR